MTATIETVNIEADEQRELDQLERDRAADRRPVAEHADQRRQALIAHAFTRARDFPEAARELLARRTGYGIHDSIDAGELGNALPGWARDDELVAGLLDVDAGDLASIPARRDWQTLQRRAREAQAAVEAFDSETGRMVAELCERHQRKREAERERSARRDRDRAALIAEAREAEPTIKAARDVLTAIVQLQRIAGEARRLGVGADALPESFAEVQRLLGELSGEHLHGSQRTEGTRTFARLAAPLRL